MAPKGEAAEKGEKKAKKPKNDGPKRGLSAYMFFSQEERPRMKEENPDASFGELGKLLGAAWKELDEADRKPFQDMAAKDKERYEEECKAAGIDPKAKKAKAEKGEKKAAPKKKAKKAASEEDEVASADEED